MTSPPKEPSSADQRSERGDLGRRVHDLERQREWMSQELERRTANVFSAVQSIAAQTLSDEWPIEQVRELFLDRLHALARAYAALDRSHGLGASLEDIVRGELHQFEAATEIDGPPITLAPTAVQPLTLMVHELASGSVRHGALSVPSGKISVQWAIEEDSIFRLSWTERSSSRPHRHVWVAEGGTLLDKISSACGLHGRAEYSPWGLKYDIEAPLAVIAAGEIRP